MASYTLYKVYLLIFQGVQLPESNLTLSYSKLGDASPDVSYRLKIFHESLCFVTTSDFE